MIEPELAFADLEKDMRCAEDYVVFCVKHLLENNLADLEFMDSLHPGCIKRCNECLAKGFYRLSYTEAVELLDNHVKSGKVKENLGHDFEEMNISWGMDLASEHEKYITMFAFEKPGPVIVYNYPAELKSFYMRQNDPDAEGRLTVAAMDVLVPGVGELIGGSQREERIDVLEKKMNELGLDISTYWWYLDLRRYGSVQHSGFGLGFERLILFTTGVENIRDVIPFPRYPGHAEF